MATIPKITSIEIQWEEPNKHHPNYGAYVFVLYSGSECIDAIGYFATVGEACRDIEKHPDISEIEIVPETVQKLKDFLAMKGLK